MTTRSREEFVRNEWAKEYPDAPTGALDRAVRLSLEGIERAEREGFSFEEARERGAQIQRLLRKPQRTLPAWGSETPALS